MKKRLTKNQKRTFLLVAIFFVLIVCLSCIFILVPTFPVRLRDGWRALTHESKRILGWENGVIPPEEKRIREEVILKKMEEASAREDWRTLAPEYPRMKKLESPNAEEKMKALKNSSEFKEMDQELKEYLKKKEDLFYPEAPTPSLKEATDLASQKDKGTEKVIERLLKSKEGSTEEKPLEENLRLGMKGDSRQAENSGETQSPSGQSESGSRDRVDALGITQWDSGSSCPFGQRRYRAGKDCCPILETVAVRSIAKRSTSG